MQLGFYLELNRCVGCETCVVACKSWNHLAPKANAIPGTQEPKWRRVVRVESGEYPNATIAWMSLGCMHCGKPACVAACPAAAITKRPQDGVVVVDQKRCIGCRYCFLACPFGVPQYGADGTMQKCNFCLERLEVGSEPACVTSCPAKALHAGTLEELSRLAASKTGRRLANATEPSVLVSLMR